MNIEIVHLGMNSKGREIVGIAFIDNTVDKVFVVSLEKLFVNFKDYHNSIIMFEEMQEYLNNGFVRNFEKDILKNIYVRTKMFPDLEVFSYDDVQVILKKRRDALFPLSVQDLKNLPNIYVELSEICDLNRCLILPDHEEFDDEEYIPFFKKEGKNDYSINENSFYSLRPLGEFFVLPTFFVDSDIIKQYIIS